MTEVADSLCSESCFAEAVTDDSLTIKNVLLCGNRSRNGYDIPATAFGDEGKVRRLYEGKPVFLDHERGRELTRSVRALAGTVRNVRFVDGRPRGDIDTEACIAGPDLLAMARKRVPYVGMSHIADYTMNRSRKAVESVNEVVSVDVVFRPATTNTFYERTEDSKVDLEVLKTELATARQERDAAQAKVSTLTAENERLKTATAEQEGKLADLSRESAELKAKVDAHESRLALEQRMAAVDAELRAAGLDPADKTVCSELFVKSLQAESEQSVRQELIADRKAILGNARPSSQERRSESAPAFDAVKFHEAHQSQLYSR